MQTHDDSNNEVIGYAVKKVAAGIGEVLKERWQEEYGDSWANEVNNQIRPPERKVNVHDPVFYFKGIIGTWHLFKEDFSPDLRNLAFRLQSKRHIWAHNTPIDDDQTIYALYQCEEMLDLLNCAFEYRDIIKKGRDNYIVKTFSTRISEDIAAKQPPPSEEKHEAQTSEDEKPTPDPTPPEPVTIEKVAPKKVVYASAKNIEPGDTLRVVLKSVSHFQVEQNPKAWMWEFQTIGNGSGIDGLNFKYWSTIEPPDFFKIGKVFEGLGAKNDTSEITQMIEEDDLPSSFVGNTAMATFDYPRGWHIAQQKGEAFRGRLNRDGKPYINIMELHPDPQD